MINSEHSKPTPAAQKKSLKRRRFQKESLQLRRRGKAKNWWVLYYDDAGHRRYHTLGDGSMTKTAAQELRDEFMRTVNGSDEPETGRLRPVLLREFIDQKYLPFQQGKWQKSTQGTSENQIKHHIVKDLGDTALNDYRSLLRRVSWKARPGRGCRFQLWTICAGMSAQYLKWLSRKR